MGTPFGSGLGGRVVEGKFPLLEWRGGSENCGTFFTVLGGMQQAIIQIFRADSPEAEEMLAQWTFASTLSHLHIARIFATGRYHVDEIELPYAVTETAHAPLAKFMRSEALDSERALNIFVPVFSALAYLHSQGVIHGHINPSTILLAGAVPKLSMADLLVAGGSARLIANRGLYDAPEALNGEITPAIDVWSAAITMFEALTNATLSPGAGVDAQIIEKMASPFRESVQDCLQTDPQRRPSAENVVRRLEGRDAAAVEICRPPAIELKDAVPLMAREAPFDDRREAALQTQWETEEQVILAPSFEHFEDAHLARFRVLPAIFSLIAIVSLVVVVLVMREHHSKPVIAVSRQAADPAVERPLPGKTSSGSPALERRFVSPAAAESASSIPLQPAMRAVAPQAISGVSPSMPRNTGGESDGIEEPKKPLPAAKQKRAVQASHAQASGETNGAVVKRVMPDVAPSAFEGNPVLVEVQVRVSVNEDGAVAAVESVSPGHGNYFARLAERAARSWQFLPPMHKGERERSVWMVRFYFARNQTEATAERTQNL